LSKARGGPKVVHFKIKGNKGGQKKN